MRRELPPPRHPARGRRRRASRSLSPPASSTSSSATSSSARSTRASSAARTTSPSIPGRDFGPGIVPLGPRSQPRRAAHLPPGDRARTAPAPPSTLPGLEHGRASSPPSGGRSARISVTTATAASQTSTSACTPRTSATASPYRSRGRWTRSTTRSTGSACTCCSSGSAASGSPAALGLLVGEAALRPVGQLTGVAEEVTATRDLSRRIDVELARRARPARLGVQRDARRARRLGEGAAPTRRRRVARAAHAARQPAHEHRGARWAARSCPPDERQKLLADVIGQVEELSALVGDLVEIDRDAAGRDRGRPSRRARRGERSPARRVRTPKVAFRAELEESVVRGAPAQLDRAVSNLLDNAAKWSDLGRRPRLGHRGDGARPRPGDRRGGPPPRLRPLLPRHERPQPARLRASGSRSSARWR